MTAAQVARYLHCSKAHVYHAINGELENVSPLPALSLGRRKLVRRATLDEWVRQNEGRLTDGIIPEKPEMGTAGRMKETNHAQAAPRRKFA